MARTEWRRRGRRATRLAIRYPELRSQKKFRDSPARFKVFCGPVGSGKTFALCYEAVRHAHRNARTTGLLGAPTYPMLRDTTIVTFLEICEEQGIRYALEKASHTLFLKDVGSRVLFRPVDQYDRLRGPNLAWFAIDELTYAPEQAWLRLEARLRDPKAKMLCGMGACTPNGFDWVHRRFVEDPVEGYMLVQAAPYENKFLLEGTPDYYERLKASYDEGLYEQEVLGRFLNLAKGRVYYAFDRSGNVGSFTVNPDEPLLWSWDFNVNPMCSVICQKVGDTVYVLDEIVLRTSSTPEVCEEFLERYGQHRGGLRVYGDASGGRSQTATGLSDFQYIRQFLERHRWLQGRIVISSTNPRVRDRINTVNGRLKNAEGERHLFVDRRCRELIKDLEQVSYKADSGQIDKERDPMRTHLSDALGYLLWQEFKPLNRIGERSQKLI